MGRSTSLFRRGVPNEDMLNLHATFTKGTVEFRFSNSMPPATENATAFTLAS